MSHIFTTCEIDWTPRSAFKIRRDDEHLGSLTDSEKLLRSKSHSQTASHTREWPQMQECKKEGVARSLGYMGTPGKDKWAPQYRSARNSSFEYHVTQICRSRNTDSSAHIHINEICKQEHRHMYRTSSHKHFSSLMRHPRPHPATSHTKFQSLRHLIGYWRWPDQSALVHTHKTRLRIRSDLHLQKPHFHSQIPKIRKYGQLDTHSTWQFRVLVPPNQRLVLSLTF